jgi:hypothetical protein
MRLILAALLIGSFGSGALHAQGTLFYIELQAVGAYATTPREVEFFSLTPDDAMQKPSLGFDLVHRLHGKTRDIGVLAVQARLAYDQGGEGKIEPQLYNAYFRLKTRSFNVWAGHNRPARGLSSVLDSHALLLPAPAMLGFGFDRDWGIGINRDSAGGGVAASLTAASGMRLRLEGNYLAAARIFKGVQAQDNYSVGLSVAHGHILETMSDESAMAETVDWTVVSLDATYLWRNFENRAEVLVGRRGRDDPRLLARRPGPSRRRPAQDRGPARALDAVRSVEPCPRRRTDLSLRRRSRRPVHDLSRQRPSRRPLRRPALLLQRIVRPWNTGLIGGAA